MKAVELSPAVNYSKFFHHLYKVQDKYVNDS